MSVSCDSCRKLIQVPKEMPHMFISSDGLTRFRCSVCQQGFEDSGYVKTRAKKSTENKLFKCIYCDKSYSSAHYLVVHRRTHTGHRPYVCDVCDKTFTCSSYLQIHKRRHTNTKPFKCKYCSRAFVQKSGLNNHIRSHTGERPYKCGVCGRWFPQLSSLRSHMNMHTEARPFKCENCCRSYRHKRHLEDHQRVHKEGKIPIDRDLSATHQCFICHRKFHCDFNLKTHIAVYHRGHVCEICGSFYLQKTELNIHLQNHENEVIMKKKDINLVSDDSDNEKGCQINFSNSENCSDSVSEKGCQIDLSESRSNASDSSCEITGVEFDISLPVNKTKNVIVCVPDIKNTSRLTNDESNGNDGFVTKLKNKISTPKSATSCVQPEITTTKKCRPKMGPKSFLARRKKLEEELAIKLKNEAQQRLDHNKQLRKKTSLVQKKDNISKKEKLVSEANVSETNPPKAKPFKSVSKVKTDDISKLAKCKKNIVINKDESSTDGSVSEKILSETKISNSVKKKVEETKSHDIPKCRKSNRNGEDTFSKNASASEAKLSESKHSEFVDEVEVEEKEEEEDDDDMPKRRKPRLKSLKWPCGLCQEECRNQCVCCDGCDTWHHLKCVGLFGDEDELDADDWYCDDCKDNKVDEEQKAEILDESCSEDSDQSENEMDGEKKRISRSSGNDTGDSSSSAASNSRNFRSNKKVTLQNNSVEFFRIPSHSKTEQGADASTEVNQGRQFNTVMVEEINKRNVMIGHEEYSKVDVMNEKNRELSSDVVDKVDNSTVEKSRNMSAITDHREYVRVDNSVAKITMGLLSTVVDHSEYAKPRPEKTTTDIRNFNNNTSTGNLQCKKMKNIINDNDKNGGVNLVKRMSDKNLNTNVRVLGKNRSKIVRNNSKIVNEHIDEILENVACGKPGFCDKMVSDIIEEGMHIFNERNVIVQSTMSGLVDDGLLNFNVIDGGDVITEEVDNFVGVSDENASIVCMEICNSEEWYFRHGHDYF